MYRVHYKELDFIVREVGKSKSARCTTGPGDLQKAMFQFEGCQAERARVTDEV